VSGVTIPVATELVPYLETAIRRSKGNLVFPWHDGEMMSGNAPLEEVLRRALGRASIVEHYSHVCRKKGCTHQERADDDRERRCPKHRYRLWPKAVVRKIRFHDLRHTTASLLMMSGANPAAVQRILRHSDPKITTEVYGRLLPGYLRSEIDRLRCHRRRHREPLPPVSPVSRAPAGGAETDVSLRAAA
jgi:integrase